MAAAEQEPAARHLPLAPVARLLAPLLETRVLTELEHERQQLRAARHRPPVNTRATCDVNNTKVKSVNSETRRTSAA